MFYLYVSRSSLISLIFFNSFHAVEISTSTDPHLQPNLYHYLASVLNFSSFQFLREWLLLLLYGYTSNCLFCALLPIFCLHFMLLIVFPAVCEDVPWFLFNHTILFSRKKDFSPNFYKIFVTNCYRYFTAVLSLGKYNIFPY